MQLGAHGVGDLEHGVGDLHRLGLAADAHVGALVAGVVHPAEGGVVTAGHERLAVHHEQPHVAVVGVGQRLLGDDVAVAADRLDHLVEVGRLVARHEEHAAAAGALQRLEHRLAAHGVDELGDLGGLARDEGARAHRLGEVLEVGLVDGVGEAVGVVDDEGAPASPRAGRRGCRRSPPTGARRRRRRDRCGSRARRGRRRRSARRARRPARSRGRRPGPCACCPWRCERGRPPSRRGGGEKSSTPISQVSCPRRVAARARRVVVYCGRSVDDPVDDEADLHAALSDQLGQAIATSARRPRRSCAAGSSR